MSSDFQYAASSTSLRLLVQAKARDADQALISCALVLGAGCSALELLYTVWMTVLSHLDTEDLLMSLS